MQISLNCFKTNIFRSLPLKQNVSGFMGHGLLSSPAQDTVSFSSRAKLLAQNMKFAPNEYNCRRVRDNAEPARFYLESVMDKYIGPLKRKSLDDKASEYPVLSCTTRLKSPSSIREKVVSKYTKLHDQDIITFSNQTYDEFAKYVPANPKYTREDTVNYIHSLITDNPLLKDVQIYDNVAFALTGIYEKLRENNYFDFSQQSDFTTKLMFTEIVDSLEESMPLTTTDGVSLIEPESMRGIKHYANDIVGARIILEESDPKHAAMVIDALKKAVEDEKLVITSIENNIPDPDRLPLGTNPKDYVSVPMKSLRSLAKEANAELIENKSKTGYLAVHINVDLSSNMLGDENSPFNGYRGEIQIIGRDIEKLKDIEDLCYKLKDNKNAIHAAYKPFKDHFNKYYKGNVKAAFDDYTYSLYLAQRAKSSSSNHEGAFPTIKDLGFEKVVPKELDFNTLKRIKSQCDQKRSEMDAEQSQGDCSTKKTLRQKADINEIKSYVTYCLK